MMKNQTTKKELLAIIFEKLTKHHIWIMQVNKKNFHEINTLKIKSHFKKNNKKKKSWPL